MSKPAYYLTVLALTITPLIAMEQQDNQGNSNQNTGWDNLPNELKTKVIGNTSARDAANAGLVNKEWHNLANDDVAWKHRFQNDFQEYQEEPGEGESWKDLYKSLALEHAKIRGWIAADFSHQMNKYHRISTLYLENKGIVSLPSNFGDLIPQTVREIDLENNRLTSLPSSMKNLTQIEMLVLNNNSLDTLPDWLSNFTNLRDLMLRGNPLAPHSVIKYFKAAPVGLRLVIAKDLFNVIKQDIQGQYVVLPHASRGATVQIQKTFNDAIHHP